MQSRSQFTIALRTTIDKFGDDKPGLSFAKLADADNYIKWAREKHYSLESARLWDHSLSDKENPKPVAIILKEKDLEDDVKLKRLKKLADNIIALAKSNVKCKGYIDCICLNQIQQEFQAVKTDWLAQDLLEWLKKRYTI